MPTINVSISTPDRHIEERVVRSYVRSALDRTDEYEVSFFGRYADTAAVSGGRVDVTFTGDPDTIRRGEVPKLDALAETHDVEYTLERGSDSGDETKFPPDQQELLDQLCALAGRMNREFFDTFDNRPPVGSIPDDEYLEVGQWVLVHMLLNQQGYGIDEEIDILTYGLRDRFGRLAAEYGLERANIAADTVSRRMEVTRTDLREQFST